MSALQHPPEHQVVALAARWREELAAVAEAPLWSLSATEAGDALVIFTQARGQLDELLMRVLRHAETVGTGLDTGATTTTSWWAHMTRTTRAEAHRTARLAASLGHHDAVRAALAAGVLLDKAAEHDAKAVASFTMSDDGHGRCHGRFSIPSLHGAMLRKDLLARAATGRTDPDKGDGRFSRHQLGLAFMDYIETRHQDTTPTAGGVAATVVVTMGLESLLGGLTAASLDTGGRISAGEARRLACRAGIIPVVLGSPSVVLDAGRRRRFHSETQRIAMGVRDGGCTAAGCDAPPASCHAHHDETPWSHGGGTSIEKGRLLCPRHHTLIHDTSFQHTLDKHGKVRFTRRT